MPKGRNKKLAEEWFKKAADDYKSAKVILKEGGYYGTTCFLAQQIAEKYFKGFLAYNNIGLQKIHDLVKLLNECKKINAGFDELSEDCILLSDYYIETRYPLDAPVDYAKLEAKRALETADSIISFIQKLIR